MLIEMIKTWNENNQTFFFSLVFILSTALIILILGSLLKTVRILFRGYPPPEQPPCDHDENLTGVCLKKGGCKTQEECNKEMEKRQ